MKIGLLYEPAYGLLLENLIRDLAREIRVIGGKSYRLTPKDWDGVDVDGIYVLPCEGMEKLKPIETQRRIINSTRSQEIAIDKIATSQRLIEAGLPTPETVISPSPQPVVEMLDRYGIVLSKATRLCGGFGHRILRRQGEQITTMVRQRTYRVTFGQRNRILDRTIELAPPYYAQRFIGTEAQTNDRVYRIYVVGERAVMGTMRVKAGVDTAEKSIINIAQGAAYQFLQPLDKAMASLALRVANLIGFEVGVVDFLRDISGQPLIIEADCDGCYLCICREFQKAPGYNESHNFNAYIAKRLREIIQGAPHR